MVLLDLFGNTKFKHMINELNKLYDEGLLYKQFHPIYPLIIWNYSPRVQYEKLWTPLLMTCRGLVTDFDGNIIAKSFSKFFNYEELLPDMIPNEPFDVFEKMDGSLGILFNYKNEWILATRGSFTSDQAIKGKEILEKNYDTTELSTYNTYLLEIIYNENRIVIDYNKEMLVLLAAFETKTGKEIPRDSLAWFSEMCGYPLVKKYKGITDYSTLKLMVSNDAEGFVIRFKNGFRMKIKGDEYCRLHRILTNISNRDVWEYLKDKKPLDDLLEKVPDEFYNWIKKTVSNFKYGYWRISEDAGKMYDYFRFGKYGDVDPMPTKKEFAEFVNKQPPIYRAIMFKMWDGKPYDELIWKMLYPNTIERPFKKVNDE